MTGRALPSAGPAAYRPVMALDIAALAGEVPGLLRYARTLAGPDEAEDLVQETVARALARADTFRGDSAVATWLHRILHNLAVDSSRRRREVAGGDLLEEAEDDSRFATTWAQGSWTVDSHRVVERAETAEELRDALARLPFIYRSAVVLHDAEGMTAPEVAQVQRIGLAAAKQRIRRGRMLLVTALAGGVERRQALQGVPGRCWDARVLVSDYLDGQLVQRDRRVVEQHLAICPTCPPLYAGLVSATAALGRMRDPDTVVPPTLAERIAALTSAAD
ncbi:RNA polymerase sigma factor SigM [Actinotalea ferrariae CF5-4]|uniref:RNA polymerase sigma factor n=2 Tax=Actinotalea TaxID=458839 RepID=A0A021VTM9_9CELL|nr:RNA polymerase sigma factor SigM [Actinotalea ferrariae CF5-4]